MIYSRPILTVTAFVDGLTPGITVFATCHVFRKRLLADPNHVIHRTSK